ncbi:hypothetical protein AbraIFM66951_011191 [Aspergillus brasiliensis]|uniref:Uncharacterized protein n=1 Tax=Aspergillus brasiliensis TaxID=319629 RepID=A0A9W5YVG0_9EURO|nr:hypothetical protein AbraCBS73388_011092 [Aspergillus brasiliensis]GKZ47634.1 hypothetical protein AbraIFM66951_011191 [Aspergillus brasiliensis]
MSDRGTAYLKELNSGRTSWRKAMREKQSVLEREWFSPSRGTSSHRADGGSHGGEEARNGEA